MTQLVDQPSQVAQQVLAKAIRKIRTEGWCQGALFAETYQGDGTFQEKSCVGGAIS